MDWQLREVDAGSPSQPCAAWRPGLLSKAGIESCEEFLYELKAGIESCEEFLYELKAGPAGGLRLGNDTAAAGEPAPLHT